MKLTFKPAFEEVQKDKIILCTLRCFVHNIDNSYLHQYVLEIDEDTPCFVTENHLCIVTYALSKCNEGDKFDRKVGERIAESRATIKALKKLNAVLNKRNKVLEKNINKTSSDICKTKTILDKELKHLDLLLKDE